MPKMPLNCPLTQAQFDDLPLEVQTSKTAIWIKDADNMDDQTLDAIVGILNHDALPALARFIAQASLTHEKKPTEDQPVHSAS